MAGSEVNIFFSVRTLMGESGHVTMGAVRLWRAPFLGVAQHNDDVLRLPARAPHVPIVCRGQVVEEGHFSAAMSLNFVAFHESFCEF